MSAFYSDYEPVAVSQTNQTLGPNGAKGDVLMRLIVSVTTADATSEVNIADGNGADIQVVPPSTPVGVYYIEIGALCANTTDPGWNVTTLAGATVLAVGKFS